MAAADLREWEQVAVVDIDNGARLETYVIPGGPGDMCLNGAAARLVQRGDRIIVISYAEFDDEDLDDYEPTIVHVDTANRQVDERTAAALATASAPGPVRYVEIQAEVSRELAGLDAELDGLS
jgi:aspartate 1-decarboxylase